jgi:hypothetical protein
MIDVTRMNNKMMKNNIGYTTNNIAQRISIKATNGGTIGRLNIRKVSSFQPIIKDI